MKHQSETTTCDRCGKTGEVRIHPGQPPGAVPLWSVVQVHGVHKDLCPQCSDGLDEFLRIGERNA